MYQKPQARRTVVPLIDQGKATHGCASATPRTDLEDFLPLAKGRRWVAAIFAFAITAWAATVAGCSPDDGPDRHSASDSGLPPPAPPAEAHYLGEVPGTDPTSVEQTSATSIPQPGEPRYAVGTLRTEFTDTKRGRKLPTIIHFPAEGSPGTVGTTKAQGEFPLVVMAHGYLLPAAGYERLLSAVTSAGYITASPAFPATSAERGNGNRADIVNQPADLSFVIDSIEQLAAQDDGPLPPVAQPDRVGAIGHSDGGLTVVALGYNEQFRDFRVAAVVVLTGGRALFPGTYLTGEDLPPLLAVHGTRDGNPYSASVSLAADVSARGVAAWLLTVENGAHIEPYMYDTALPQLGRAVADFFDAYLRGIPGATEQLLSDATLPGQLRIEQGGK